MPPGSRRLGRLRARYLPIGLLLVRLPGGRARLERRLTARIGDPAEITAREEVMSRRILALDVASPAPGTVTDWAWPVRGEVRSGFGPRAGRMHYGIDVPAPAGAPIEAAADGEVRLCVDLPDYGRTTVLGHGCGITTVYGHQSEVLVQAGERVRRGDVIGRVGASGRATGPHLHFEIRYGGTPQDPTDLLPR